MGFDGTLSSMSSYLVVNILVLIFAIIWWQYSSFSAYLFWLGLLGSIINTIGLSLINTAISCGPMGPVAAIGSCANILLVVIEAIKN